MRQDKSSECYLLGLVLMDARGRMREFLVKESLHFRAKSRNAVEVRGQFVGVDALLPPSRSWGLNPGRQA